MQCSCGGTTIERTVVENKEVAIVYQHCQSCGRVLITKDKQK